MSIFGRFDCVAALSVNTKAEGVWINGCFRVEEVYHGAKGEAEDAKHLRKVSNPNQKL
jgi:hypothetical protein